MGDSGGKIHLFGGKGTEGETRKRGRRSHRRKDGKEGSMRADVEVIEKEEGRKPRKEEDRRGDGIGRKKG